jgi:hypothetical protein
VPRKSREEEIITSVRKYLDVAVSSLEAITDERIMKAAKCSRATFYKYITKGSAIEHEIEVARGNQKRFAEAVKRGNNAGGQVADWRKRFEESERSKRELLGFNARVTANLIKYGVPIEKIQAAQQDAMPHPNRSFSHAGRARRRR